MTFNIWTFLFEIVNFVVLAAILYRLLYRPLRAAIEQRKADNDRAKLEAEAARKEAEATRLELARQLAEAENQRQAVLAKANEAAEAAKAKKLAEAETAAQAVRDQARRDAEQLHRETLAGLEGEVAALAVGLADRLLAEAATSSLNGELTHKLIDSIHAASDADREAVRRDGEHSPAVVQSAFELDESLRQQVMDAVQGLLGQTAEVRFEVAPACVCGSRLQVGGRVWDATAAAQMDVVRSALNEHGRE